MTPEANPNRLLGLPRRWSFEQSYVFMNTVRQLVIRLAASSGHEVHLIDLEIAVGGKYHLEEPLSWEILLLN